MDQQTNTGNTSIPQNLVSEEQKKAFIIELGLESLDESQKNQLLGQMTETVLNRIFIRVSPALTQKDIQHIDSLQRQNSGDEVVARFLFSKIPSLGGIIQEEVNRFSKEMRESVETIKATLVNQ